MNVFIHIEIRANHHDKNFALRLTLKEIETEGKLGNGVHSASMLVRCSCIVRFLLLYIGQHNVSLLAHGCSQWGSWGARDPSLASSFNQTNYNRWRKCHDDILAIVTIWQSGEYPHSVTPLSKILATPLF